MPSPDAPVAMDEGDGPEAPAEGDPAPGAPASEVAEDDEVRAQISEIDKALQALLPLAADAEIALLIEKKRAERQILSETLRGRKPLQVRWRRAVERREKLAKKAESIREEILLLRATLSARHISLSELKCSIENEDKDIAQLEILKRQHEQTEHAASLVAASDGLATYGAWL